MGKHSARINSLGCTIFNAYGIVGTIAVELYRIRTYRGVECGRKVRCDVAIAGGCLLFCGTGALETKGGDRRTTKK